MKIQKNIWLLLGVLIATMGFYACDDDDDPADSSPITVSAIYLQDAESEVPDREVPFARLGQVIRIEGSGFTGLRKIYVNGYDTYFNPVYVTNNNILLRLSRNTPTIDAEDNVRNTIRLVKTGTEYVYEFEIRAAAPQISKLSHTLPQPGEPLIIYGSGLVEIEKVVFPGNVEVTEGIVSDEDGDFVTVVVPDGLTESGSVYVEGANGGAYSPAYFNFREGIILDFDGNGQQGYWGDAESMIVPEDLKSEVIGTGNISQGTYVPHRPDRIESFGANQNRLTEVWTAGNDVDDWRGQLTPHIPASTPVNQVAFQFDIYVPDAWANTGFLKILLINNYNGGEWSGYTYNYVPWIVEKEVVPFETDGWVTVTIPFSEFYAFSEPEEGEAFTFEDVLLARENATYKNFGFYFENSDFTLADVTGNDSDETEFISSETSVDVYTDNWRVVPLEQPVYTDFPAEEETTEE
jgi:hypothetical protein